MHAAEPGLQNACKIHRKSIEQILFVRGLISLIVIPLSLWQYAQKEWLPRGAELHLLPVSKLTQY